MGEISEAEGAQLWPDSQAPDINGSVALKLHFVEKSDAGELEHRGRLQRLFRMPSAPVEDAFRASDIHGGGGMQLETDLLLRSSADTGSHAVDAGDELSQEYCSQCGTLVPIGDFLWECSGGCDFMLCEPCAAQQEIPVGTDFTNGGKASLADRIDAALAPECKDMPLMQSLVDECTETNYEHPQAFALRSKLTSNTALNGAAVPPPMSPAEGRRRMARGLEPFSGRRQRNAALGLNLAATVESAAEDHQVVEWMNRLNELKLPPPLSTAALRTAESMAKTPPHDPRKRAPPQEPARRAGTLEVAFL